MRLFLRPLAVILTVFLMLFLFVSNSFAQPLNRVFVANGGTFEFAPPYSDYVTVGTINELGAYTSVNTIFTQSVQQALTLASPLSDAQVLVAAQDSLVLFQTVNGLTSRLHTAAIPDTYGSFHAIYQVGNDIFAGEWYGSDAIFLHLYNNDLQLQSSIVGIDQDVRSMIAIGDTLYIAQNLPTANFGDSLGYISKVHIPSHTYLGRFGFGNVAFTGVSDLFNYHGTLVAIGRQQGEIIKYTPRTGAIQTTTVGNLGKAFYLKNDEICLVYQNKPYNYNLQNGALTDLSCYIANTGNSVVSATPQETIGTFTLPAMWFSTDFSTAGDAYLKTGTCTYSHTNVGISPEATAVFNASTVTNTKSENSLVFATISPNPISTSFSISTKNNTPFSIKMTDVFGTVLVAKEAVYDGDIIDISPCSAGIYFLILQNNQGKTVKKIEIIR